MSNEKESCKNYGQITEQVLDAEKKFQKAADEFAEDLKKIFSELTASDMVRWMQSAKKDDSVSARLFETCMRAYAVSQAEAASDKFDGFGILIRLL